MKKEEIVFLKESNAIERKYSEQALKDAVDAWRYAKKYKNKNYSQIYIDMILEIHKKIMKNLNPRIAGKIRDVPVYVVREGIARKCLPPEKIKDELRELCNLGLNPYYLGERWIKEWHIKFEKIHPFEDGNGRVGRILMNIQRLKIDLPLLIIHEGKEQYDYYKWFKELK